MYKRKETVLAHSEDYFVCDNVFFVYDILSTLTINTGLLVMVRTGGY